MLESEELGNMGLSPATSSQAVAAVLRTLTRGCRRCRCCQRLSGAGGERGKGGAELLKWVRHRGARPGWSPATTPGL